MIRTRTFLADVFVLLLFLLPAPFHADRVHAMPCDNSQAESVIPAKEKVGRYLMPKEIQDHEEEMAKLKDARLTEEDIRRCLANNRPLKNHVIDFDRYVAAWMEINDPTRVRVILYTPIQDSVLWSFKKKGQVNLAALAIDTQETDGTVTHSVAGQIEWHNVTLGPSFSAKEIKFPPKTSFGNSRFPNKADFLNATFGERTSFKNTTFGESTSFKGATFGDKTRFDDATFGDKTRFDDATFGDKASFWNTTFGNHSFFWKATFGDDPFFVGANFGNDAYFARATFRNAPFFWRTTFGEKASFEMATFGDDTRFDEAIFEDEASFLRAIFRGDISLRHATFKGKLNLAGTKWEGRADLRETEIQDLCWNSKDYPSSVKGVFDAREAKFKKAVFKEVRFSDLVDFSDVEFGRSGEISSDKDKSKKDFYGCEADEPSSEQSEQKTEDFGREAEVFIFQNLIFEKEVDFLRATFRNDTIFVRNRFHGVWDLTGVTFKGPEEKKKSPSVPVIQPYQQAFHGKRTPGLRILMDRAFHPELTTTQCVAKKPDWRCHKRKPVFML